MPPKVKTEKEAIVYAAFEVAKVEGVAAITAQNVSKVLKTSVAPIFRVIQTVEELRTVTTEKINEFHTQYIIDYQDGNSEFLTYGNAYIQFAREYPQLFEALMLPCATDIGEQMMGELAFAVNSTSKESGLAIPEGQEKKLLEAAFKAFLESDRGTGKGHCLMIGIYFSGTGNTKHCLKVFMSEIDQEVPCISIEDENAGFGDEKALKNIDIADG